jgi:hypothetical protein
MVSAHDSPVSTRLTACFTFCLLSHACRYFCLLSVPTWCQLLNYRDTLFSIPLLHFLPVTGSVVCCTLILHCFAFPYIVTVLFELFDTAALYATQFNHVLSMTSRPQSQIMVYRKPRWVFGNSAGLARDDPYLLISRSNGVLTLTGESLEVSRKPF